ncbi:ABC transporter substrate-binding protein [soil metagenome]
MEEERTRRTLSDFDWSVLSGPRVSRRTMMKLAAATGAIPFASWLAACGDDDDDDDDDGATTDDPTAADEPAGEDPTEEEDEEEPEDDPTPTAAGVSGTAAEATPTTPETAQAGGRLVIGFPISEITQLDPALVNQGVVAGELISNLFSALVQFDENLGVVADLAEDWEVSEDGTQYTFHIREGLTHHNGDTLNANDFVYTYERNTDPDFASPHANKLESITEIVATDDQTLSITLSEPFAPFLAVACTRGPGRALTPISQRAFEEMGGDAFTLAPVGCGPFRLLEETRERGVGFTMVPFEDWYGEGPLLDEVVIQIITEPSSQISALEAGDIDMLFRAPTTGVEQLEANSDLTVVRMPGTSWAGLTMNYDRPPWDNPVARMAVSKAINRQAFVDTAFLGLAIPGYNAIAPAFGWVYEEIDVDDPSQNPQGYDLEEAQRLAEEAGIVGTQATIIGVTGGERTREVMRDQLSEIGVDLVLDIKQSAANNEQWLAGDYDMNINGSVVDADPDDGHWNFFFSEGPWNTYGYNDPEADRLLLLTRSTNDVEARRQAWLDLAQLLNENVAYAFLNHTIDFVAYHGHVKGFREIPEIRHLETVYIEE